MPQGERDGKVRELMMRGFSKTKSTQALKDAGNNTTLALRILERQQQNEAPHPGPSSVTGALNNGPHYDKSNKSDNKVSTSHTTATIGAAASIPSLHRTPKTSNTAFAATDMQRQLQRQRGRRHPCVVQYGSCWYGDACLLKDFPGDVCVQYFQGCCIYGAACRHRHVVDGVDVRDVWRQAAAVETEALQQRGVSDVAKAWTDTRNSNEYSKPDGRGVESDAVFTHTFTQEMQGPGFNAAAALSPAYADPFQLGVVNSHMAESNKKDDWASDSEDGDDNDSGDTVGEEAVAHHPTPFLDIAQAGATAGAAAVNGVSAVRPLAFRTPPAGKTTAVVTGAVNHNRRHPCVAQFGHCKYGDNCLHADRDADVCVLFLNGRCRYSAEECRYRHESAEAYQQILRARVGLDKRDSTTNSNTGANAAKDEGITTQKPSSSPSTTHSLRPKKRLQSAEMCVNQICSHHPSPRQLSDNNSENGSYNGFQTGQTPSPGPATSSSGASPLPVFSDLNAPTSTLSKESSTQDVASASAHISDVEMSVFLSLLEVFPQVEPAVVLQTLRLCGGDVIKTSDMINRFGAAMSPAEVENLAAALALVAAEEATEREAAATTAEEAKAMDRHNVLLTLLMLFPSVDVSSVEAVLTQSKNDFATAYNVLLCTQEKMARAALWKGSSAALSPVDQLRVEKLYAMFPGLHSEIVRSAFCASNHNWNSATAALNELTKELLSLEAVEMPAKPVVWHPTPTSNTTTSSLHALDQSASSCGPAAAAAFPTVEETSEKAYEAYRAAEKEILGYGDWRQVRQQAYLLNTQRIRVLGQASAAFHQGDGRMAKLLSREGHRMAVEYNRLNRLAMLALEQERLRTEATSTLDLHGFHTAEVHDVVVRRVEVCQRKRIGHLRIVVGEGLHSKHGHRSLYTALMEVLRTDAYLKVATKVKSVKAGYIDVAVQLPARDS